MVPQTLYMNADDDEQMPLLNRCLLNMLSEDMNKKRTEHENDNAIANCKML